MADGTVDIHTWIERQLEAIYEEASREAERIQKILNGRTRVGDTEGAGGQGSTELRVRVRRLPSGAVSIEWLSRKWWRNAEGRARFRTSYVRKGTNVTVPASRLKVHARSADMAEVLAAEAAFSEYRKRVKRIIKLADMLKELGLEGTLPF